MRHLRQGVHAGIGPAGPVQPDGLAAEARDRGLQDLLHREPGRLALPAHEPGAVVFEHELVARHQSRSPGRNA